MKKRKSKTPAQDRLQTWIDTKETAVIDSFKEVSKSLTKLRKSSNNATAAKKLHFEKKSKQDEVDSAKLLTNGTEKNANEQIPSLFPLKTPAQERLNLMQNKRSDNECRGGHDAERVFGETFGIESGKPTAAAPYDDVDEMAMDWEPCQDTNYTFQELESMAVDVLIDSAYIIPDTNVFIDSLASIKAIIEKGESNRCQSTFNHFQ